MSAASALSTCFRSTIPRSFRLEIVEVGSLRWGVNPGVDLQTISHVLERPDDFLKDRALLFKNSALVTIGRVPARQPGHPGMVLRRLNYGRFQHRFRDFFRPSRAHRAMRHSLALAQAGIATPRALAVADVRKCRWPQTAYFLTEEIAPVTRLRRYLADERHVSGRVVASLADLFARMHSSGFIHGDAKSTNILLDANLRPWLIDLDGVRQFARTPRARAVLDLARLAWEVRQNARLFKWSGLRFLVWYCRCRKESGSERDWAARVLASISEFD